MLILRMVSTIADLAACEKIQPEHVAESVQYRSLDRIGWADKFLSGFFIRQC